MSKIVSYYVNNGHVVLNYITFKCQINCSPWYNNLSYIYTCITDCVSKSYNESVFILQNNIVFHVHVYVYIYNNNNKHILL